MYKGTLYGDTYSGGGIKVATTTKTVYIKGKRSCGVCQSMKEAGLSLGSLFLCQDCEQEIMRLEPGEDAYQTCVDALKRLWN
ncbi:Inhibitor of sigma-G Gin [Shouchella rhizosphaerae]|uniref:Sigma factor G inhibitor Gin n=1 Tax=Shouchella clausii TaxID=79880 RepID=A0A268NTY5_SHOCL|nr:MULTISPECIES: sigma factor G inhibitor Gin [Shouchella]MCZ1183960.1 hypothetical protein [Shouchella clausii]PAD13805.1 hypothetical protein CHH73_19800 [Shouchella clausii]PAD45447.1 hypothetical protein CHI09_17460 [Shouchella clausii]PAE79669.1 hypothetical protein CHH77_19440 [Shouchella clausii]PAE86977.1 hypothetical protein CHH72_21030 [Shouchella clausii]